jgi:PTS system ascorbate-specific IIA component
MNNGILIIAHAPLATALRQCIMHVFPDAETGIMAFDVQPNVPPEETLAGVTMALAILNTPQTLVLTDVFGATPCNAAQKLVDGVNTKLLAGVNLPMLLRTVAGGTQGVMQVASTAPQNQTRKKNDPNHNDHQQ